MKSIVIALALVAFSTEARAESPKAGERGTMLRGTSASPDPFAYAKSRIIRGFQGNAEANAFEEAHAFVYVRPGVDVVIEKATGEASCVTPAGASECLWVDPEKVGPRL